MSKKVVKMSRDMFEKLVTRLLYPELWEEAIEEASQEDRWYEPTLGYYVGGGNKEATQEGIQLAFNELVSDIIIADINIEEFPGCCGFAVLEGLGELNILKLLSALRDALDSKYAVVYATDLANAPSKPVLLSAGFTIERTFKSLKTQNIINVYAMEIPKVFDYDKLYADFTAQLKPKRVRTKKAVI